MKVSAQIVTGLVALSLLGGGAYWARGMMRCQALEDDFLNSVSGLRQSDTLRALGGSDSALAKAEDSLAKINNDRVQMLTEQLVTECGESAAQTAIRKGYESMAR